MFSKRLRKLRQKKKLTQWQLAEILNLSTSAITMYELGKRMPDLNIIIKIANYFNVSVDYLIGTSDIPNKKNISENNLYNSINELPKEKIDFLKKFIDLLANNDESTTK